MDRRTFIRITGGGIALAAGATLPGCSADYPAAAVEAWRGPRDEADPRRWALGFAILAPNPHNRQPWLVDLGQPDQIRLFIDRERLLPETDPFARQIVIGHGTFLELLALALAERGYAADVHLFPEGEPGAAVDARPVAHVRLVSHEGTARDPLFSRILERRSNKQAYDPTRPLTPEVQRVLLGSVAGRSVTAAATTEPARMAELRRIARAAWVAEMTTARTYLESARLFRVGPGEIARHRDGISMNSPMLRALNLAGLFDRTEVPVPGSTLYGRVMERWADAETAAGYVWITTDGKSRAAQIEAGRAFARMQLTATSLGLGMHPLSQALQEFEEVRPYYEAMHLALGVEPARQTLQMFARTGYGAPAPPTPRRGVDAIVRA